jgi:hypothetical protein
MRITHLLILLTLVSLSGCAMPNVDKNFGSAYAQMVREQTYDVSTRNTGQGDRVIEGVDPDSANAALENMRKDTAGRGIRTAPVINSTQQGGGGGGGGGGGQ